MLLEISQIRSAFCASYCNARTLILLCLSCWLKCWNGLKIELLADCAIFKVNCKLTHALCHSMNTDLHLFLAADNFGEFGFPVGRSTGESTIVCL